MTFMMGSSCFLHSPIHTSASSLCCYSSGRKIDSSKTRNCGPMACFSNEASKNDEFCKRREILFLGVSILPFLQLKARAVDGLVTDERDVRTPEEKKQTEDAIQTEASPNPFVSLVNGLGIVSSGVLGAFYVLAQQEKKDAESSLESVKTKLKEKETASISMENAFEMKLQKEQEERTKQQKKAQEEEQSLLNQLISSNSTIKGLGQELQSEKRLTGELKIQIDSLKTDLSKAGEDKKILEEKLKDKLDSIEVLQEKISLLSMEIKDREDKVKNLESSLTEKNVEVDKLNGVCVQTKRELAKANSDIEGRKEKLTKYEEEIKSKSVEVSDLNAKVSVLCNERDGLVKRVDAVLKEFNGLKISSENAAALSSKILGEKDEEIQQVRGKLELAFNQASENQNMIVELTREKDDLMKMLDSELISVKNLKNELQVTRETLETSKQDAHDLTGQLKKSRNLCTELETKLFSVGAEFSEAKHALQKSLDDAKKNSEVIASQLRIANELVKKTKDELQTTSQELTTALENGVRLKEELVHLYKKAERATNDLKEENEKVTSLNNKLQSIEKQITSDKEARKYLETDLENAIKSLDEMNRNTILLSKELEIANSNVSVLEEEKRLLYNSLSDQKIVSKGAMENMEDAHNLVLRLGKERESLDKKGRKLEDELASAKGEILRLRSKIKSSTNEVIINNQKPRNVDKPEENGVAAEKKSGRRRKNSS